MIDSIPDLGCFIDSNDETAFMKPNQKPLPLTTLIQIRSRLVCCDTPILWYLFPIHGLCFSDWGQFDLVKVVSFSPSVIRAVIPVLNLLVEINREDCSAYQRIVLALQVQPLTSLFYGKYAPTRSQTTSVGYNSAWSWVPLPYQERDAHP